MQCIVMELTGEYYLINKTYYMQIKEFVTGKNAMRNILAIGWSLFAMIYTYKLTFSEVPQSGVRFADVSQGFVMGTIVGGVISYYFGSSQGSADKNDLIKEPLAKGASKTEISVTESKPQTD